jgi:hypothetical protein
MIIFTLLKNDRREEEEEEEGKFSLYIKMSRCANGNGYIYLLTFA